MRIPDLFALIISCLTLSTALMTILARNAVYAAFYLLLTLIGVAAAYVLLSAHFLAVIQILVYAGAVVVLIVFVLMMLGFGKEQLQGFELSGPALILPLLMGGILVTAGGIGMTSGHWMMATPLPSSTVSSATQQNRPSPLTQKTPSTPHQPEATEETYGTIHTVGKYLITHHLLAFEIISILFLMAIGGVVVLLRERTLPSAEDLSHPTEGVR